MIRTWFPYSFLNEHYLNENWKLNVIWGVCVRERQIERKLNLLVCLESKINDENSFIKNVSDDKSLFRENLR